eukprot:4152770-Prymnesium_polylepis.3
MVQSLNVTADNEQDKPPPFALAWQPEITLLVRVTLALSAAAKKPLSDTEAVQATALQSMNSAAALQAM